MDPDFQAVRSWWTTLGLSEWIQAPLPRYVGYQHSATVVLSSAVEPVVVFRRVLFSSSLCRHCLYTCQCILAATGIFWNNVTVSDSLRTLAAGIFVQRWLYGAAMSDFLRLVASSCYLMCTGTCACSHTGARGAQC